MGANLKLSRIQKRGQVTIPVEIRQKLHLEEGDLVAFIETEEGIILSPQDVVAAAARPQEDASIQQDKLEQVFTFAERMSQANLEGQPPLAISEGPSIVEMTAGIFRRRQDGQQEAIDFERARQAFIEYLAQKAMGNATDSEP